MNDEPDVGTHPHGPESPIARLVQFVDLHPGRDGVQLEIEGGGLDGLLLVAGEAGEGVAEGVRDAEVHDTGQFRKLAHVESGVAKKGVRCWRRTGPFGILSVSPIEFGKFLLAKTELCISWSLCAVINNSHSIYMQSEFAEYYSRTEAELSEIWRTGMLAIDANVLLDLYAYPEAALDEFFRVIESFRDRVWIPYQVGVEYQRNRLKALPQPRQALEQVARHLGIIREKTDALGFPDHHPTLDLAEAEKFRQRVAVALDELENQIKNAMESLPTNTYPVDADDRVRDRLQAIFGGRIGQRPDSFENDRLRREADGRFARQIPPGYKDAEKETDRKYGDYFIWRALLTQMKMRSDLGGLIFVTNDRKEDWWLRRESQLLGPRPELIRECLDETGRLLLLYTPSDFLKASQQLTRVAVSETTLEAAAQISQQSRVQSVLHIARMSLPDISSRVDALREVYEEMEGGRVASANDVSAVIERRFGSAQTNYVSTPFFFSLINEAYGPLQVDSDPNRRLRDRSVSVRSSVSDAGSFIRTGHVAWLAQAMYRLRRHDFTRHEIAQALFGVDAGNEALQLVEEAERAMTQDILIRGQ